MAISTGTAKVDMVLTLDPGFSPGVVQFIADLMDAHPEIGLVSSDSEMGTITCEVEYTIEADEVSKTFEATRVDGSAG